MKATVTILFQKCELKQQNKKNGIVFFFNAIHRYFELLRFIKQIFCTILQTKKPYFTLRRNIYTLKTTLTLLNK